MMFPEGKTSASEHFPVYLEEYAEDFRGVITWCRQRLAHLARKFYKNESQDNFVDALEQERLSIQTHQLRLNMSVTTFNRKTAQEIGRLNLFLKTWIIRDGHGCLCNSTHTRFRLCFTDETMSTSQLRNFTTIT